MNKYSVSPKMPRSGAPTIFMNSVYTINIILFICLIFWFFKCLPFCVCLAYAALKLGGITNFDMLFLVIGVHFFG